jgi:large subunit ribosomal protein L4
VKGEEVGKLELKDAIFGLKVSREFLHEYVTIYETNQRRGTAHTKTRSEVSGGGKKPWKQKGTGRARAGSTRSPLWRHGGVTFGPRQGHNRAEIPRQKARAALAQALAAKNEGGALIVVESFGVAEAKTREVAAALKALGCGDSALVVVEAHDAKLSRAGRNLPGFSVSLAADINAYSVLRAKKLVITRAALEKLGTRWN